MSVSGAKYSVTRYEPNNFEPEAHYYPKVLNAQLHPLVRGFMNLGNERIAERYSHLHPEISRTAILEALSTRNKHLNWAGADLFCVTNDQGIRKVVVIELNSCPSGQKSTPVQLDHWEQGGYRTLLEGAFLPKLKRRGLPKGDLAVLYDKNKMESSGYASTLADLTGEHVWLVPFYREDSDPPARFTEEGILEIRDPEGSWITIRGAFRYVTQAPWSRIPPVTKTPIFNPVLGCLAGGRNKMLAAKAYDLFNAEMSNSSLVIRTPETIWDVARDEVPMWVNRMGGVAVVKNPYSNAGQGVYTITNSGELAAFMASEQHYERFIVQALIGNSGWSSRSRERLYHVGTVPDKKNRIYAADLRFMVGSGDDGFFPVAVYARRAKCPLTPTLDCAGSSWDMLGTNLSYIDEGGNWQSETERLLLADNRDFNKLGIGLDDLIESYLQTILAAIAIDNMASSLLSSKGKFKRRFFNTINPDDDLLQEICQ